MNAALSFRPARLTDAGQVGAILSANVDAAPWMPRLYTRAQEIGFADQMIANGWVEVACLDRSILGFSARHGCELFALYVHPEAQGYGIGRGLLSRAKARAGRLALWSYQPNRGAERFYLREGFLETLRSDGAGNDAGIPDIRFEWNRAEEHAP